MTEEKKAEIKAVWAQKTPEEQVASLKRFYDEVVQKGVKGIREAFAEARRQAEERELSCSVVAGLNGAKE